jgi:hypothetical protein
MKPFTRLLAVVAAAALIAPAAASANVYNVAIATRASSFTQVFDVSGGSTDAGAKVIQYIVTGGANQRWNFINTRDSLYEVVNAKTGYCLTSNGVTGAQLYVTYCNTANPRQQWFLPPQLKNDTFQTNGGTLSWIVSPGSTSYYDGVTKLPTYGAAEVKDNSWQPGAAIVSGTAGFFNDVAAQRLAYWYWG